MIGQIPVYNVSARTKLKVDASCPRVNEVWSKREINNRRFLQSLTEDATIDHTEKTCNIFVEARKYNVAVANRRNRHGAHMGGNGIDVEGKARIVRRVMLF